MTTLDSVAENIRLNLDLTRGSCTCSSAKHKKRKKKKKQAHRTVSLRFESAADLDRNSLFLCKQIFFLIRPLQLQQTNADAVAAGGVTLQRREPELENRACCTAKESSS